MTKKELVEAILTDMHKHEYKHDSKEDVDKNWKSWLERQQKSELEEILEVRKNS